MLVFGLVSDHIPVGRELAPQPPVLALHTELQLPVLTGVSEGRRIVQRGMPGYVHNIMHLVVYLIIYN